MKESDAFQDKDSGQGICTCTIFGKHRPQQSVSKWFQAKRALGSFQGGEEEVNGGKDTKMIAIVH
jgi:hypothetical protein